MAVLVRKLGFASLLGAGGLAFAAISHSSELELPSHSLSPQEFRIGADGKSRFVWRGQEGLNFVLVTGCGGGGGGGQARSRMIAVNGPGGPSSYKALEAAPGGRSSGIFTLVIPVDDNVYEVNIGKGGQGGSSNGANGIAGGPTTFARQGSDTQIFSLPGGAPGTFNSKMSERAESYTTEGEGNIFGSRGEGGTDGTDCAGGAGSTTQGTAGASGSSGFLIVVPLANAEDVRTVMDEIE